MHQQTSLKELYAAFRRQRRRNLILIVLAAAIPTLLAALCGRLEIVICILFFALPIGMCIFAVFNSKALKQLTSHVNKIRTPHLIAALQEHYADVRLYPDDHFDNWALRDLYPCNQISGNQLLCATCGGHSCSVSNLTLSHVRARQDASDLEKILFRGYVIAVKTDLAPKRFQFKDVPVSGESFSWDALTDGILPAQWLRSVTEALGSIRVGCATNGWLLVAVNGRSIPYADIHQLDEEAVRRNAEEAAALYRKSIDAVMSHPALSSSGNA